MSKLSVRKTLVAIAAGGVLAGTGLLFAGEANADIATDSYLEVLHDQGIYHTDGDAGLVNAGHGVCTMLYSNGGDTMAVIEFVYVESQMDAYDSGYLVGAATAAFCPDAISQQSGWVA